MFQLLQTVLRQKVNLNFITNEILACRENIFKNAVENTGASPVSIRTRVL